MASGHCRRAKLVSGAPRSVVAWIDQELHEDVLFLNADLYTAAQEAAITAALNRGRFTTSQVIAAFVTTEG